MFSRKVDVSECFEKWAGLDAAEEATRTEIPAVFDISFICK